MDEEKIQKLTKKLNNINNLTQKMEGTLKNINQLVAEVPTDILNLLKTYTEPRKKINDLLHFYETSLQVHKTTEGLIKNYKNEKVKVCKNIQSIIKLIDSDIAIENELLKLEYYNSINVVNTYIKEVNDTISETEYIAINAFFSNYRKTKHKDDCVFLAKFLQNKNKKKFLKNYIEDCIQNYYSSQKEISFFEVVNMFARAENEIMIEYRLIDLYIDSDSKNVIKKEISSSLIVYLKTELGKKLSTIQTDFEYENLKNLGRLYEELLQNFNSNKFNEFIDVIKNTIDREIKRFIKQVNQESEHVESYRVEQFASNSRQIMDIFSKNDFTSFFHTKDYNSYESFKAFFATTCLNRLSFLSKNMKKIFKEVYLINNYDEIVEFYNPENNLSAEIETFCNSIVSSIKEESEKKYNTESDQFLMQITDGYKNIFLKPKYRENIINEIKKIIDNLHINSKSKLDIAMLNVKVEKMFTGES